MATTWVSSTTVTPPAITRIVKELAGGIGFDRVGVTHAGPVEHGEYYRRWLAAGHAGSMRYLQRHVRLRCEPAGLLPGAQSIVCLALNYRRVEGESSEIPSESQTGRVAQYARGRDYHVVMRRMLEELVAGLRQRLDETFEAHVFVDTGPVLERELARAAGLGWMGKNTCLLHEKLGSYLFLGEVLTTLRLVPDEPVEDRCGNCTRCLDACPTRAFPAPYQLDASRCISCFTIEHRGEVPPEFHAGIGDWVFGCDICQQVCPYNDHAPHATHPEISEDRLPPRLDLQQLLNLRSGEYRRLTRDSATRRAGRNMWRRNAAIALGNRDDLDDAALRTLADAAEDSDAGVSTAAAAVLARKG